MWRDVNGRTKALVAVLALLLPAALLWSFVLGVADPGASDEPTATYEVRYEGETLALTQTSGRVRTGTLAVVAGSGGERAVLAEATVGRTPTPSGTG